VFLAATGKASQVVVTAATVGRLYLLARAQNTQLTDSVLVRVVAKFVPPPPPPPPPADTAVDTVDVLCFMNPRIADSLLAAHPDWPGWNFTLSPEQIAEIAQFCGGVSDNVFSTTQPLVPSLSSGATRLPVHPRRWRVIVLPRR
jgi:hypothetical protein